MESNNIKILIIIPGITNDTFVMNIRKNIDIMKQYNKINFDIYLYNHTNTILSGLNIDIVENGNLGLYNVLSKCQNIVDNYDYVIVMLDDVEIVKLDLYQIIKIYEQYNFDILSPSVSFDSVWSHMNMKYLNKKQVNVVKCLELFYYFMKPCVYKKWCSIMTDDNHYGWGIDCNMYTLLNFRLGINHENYIRHLKINRNYYDVAENQMIEWLKKHNKTNKTLLNDYCDDVIDSFLI